MDNILEKLNSLFLDNKKWRDEHPFTSGGENPSPNKIKSLFRQYFNENYIALVSYYKYNVGEIKFQISEFDIQQATNHAWFDCVSLEECFDFMRHWIRNRYCDMPDDDEGDGDIIIIFKEKNSVK